MRNISLFFILLIMWTGVAGAQSIITVDVNESGNARWIMEKRFLLSNQTEIDYWEELMKNGTDVDVYQKDNEDFKLRIDWFLRSAEMFSNRSMKAEKFNISYDMVKTPSTAFGIIQYRFEWKNFSYADHTKILIGDAFSEGQVLSSDNVLVIKIPDGYEIQSTSPGFDKRDGNRLIWDGTLYRSFGKGEPSLVLTRTGNGHVTSFMILVMLGLISGAAAVIWRRNKNPGIIHGNDTSSEKDSYLTPLHGPIKGGLEDKELIEEFLAKSGNEAFQSEIVRQTGLSKSKVSIVLAQMKEDGKILKIRKGKENLIRLTK